MEYLSDTHCHLNFKAFAEDAEEVILRSKKAGVELMIVIGTDVKTSCKAVELAQNYDYIFAAVGYHPIHVNQIDEETLRENLEEIRQLSSKKKVVAIGEIGLDYFREPFNKELQRIALKELINLAKEIKKPVILHAREALEELIGIVEKEKDLRGVFHCFSGNMAQAKRVMGAGLYLGFNGLITYSGDEENRDVARQIPLEKLLIETDCPYLTPIPHRGERNEPAYVRYVIKEISELKSIEEETIAKQSLLNAKKLFRLD
jgi:TatD DNase family protein